MESKKRLPAGITEHTFLFIVLLCGQFVSSNTQSPPPPSPPPPAQSLLSPLQASTLFEVKEAIDLTGTATSTWNLTAPCSSWGGVTCDTSLNVVSINLTLVGLSGTLPSSLGSLTSLETLILSGNWISGPIPESLYSLTKLQNLDLSLNNLNLTISENIGNLTSLTNLDLSSNLFTGSIPNNVALLVNLTNLNLERNSLSGEIPDVFSGLTVLTTLNLAYNQFTGSIPTSVTTLPAIVSLNLQNNGLNGTISSSLATSLTLKNLILDTNSISGSIPMGFTSKTSPLLKLSLGSNLLTGVIPAWNPNNLTYLDLSANSFTGFLYTSFQTPPLSLLSLFLNNNSIAGPLPESFQNLTQLQVLDLSFNLLSGNLPVNLSKCTSLTRLDISFNLFSGPLPPSYTTFPKLQQLSIQSNSLSGTMNNYNFQNLTSAVRLSLGSNQFSGGLPLGLPLPLLTLDVSYNVLSGEINGSIFDFSTLKNMTAVLLNNNQFSGAFPYQLWNNSVLQYVAANNNSIVSVPSTSISTIVDQGLAHIVLGGNPICSDSNTLNSFCVLAKDLSLDWTPSTETINNPTKCYDSGNCPSPLFYSIPAYNISGECICSKPLNITFLLNQCPFLVYDQNFDLLSFALRKLTSLNLAIPLNQIWIPAASLADARGAQLIVMQFYGGLDDFLDIDKPLASTIVTKFQKNPSFFGKWGPLTYIDSKLTSEELASIAEAVNAASTIEAWAIALIVVGVLALGVIFVLLYLLWRKPAHGYKSKLDQEIEENSVRHLTFEDILLATNHFDDDNILGEGGYGTVYKGQARNGDLWAVKKSKRSMDKGALEEFHKEVRTISRFAHTNIVKLVGYCENDSEQVLVYEFCQNGTLTQHLRPKGGKELLKYLTFEERLDIAIGTAEALKYMHTFSTPAIIHRDIKSDNILLDDYMQAKVADFGLLKDLPKKGKELEQNSLHIAGTPGYMDPEFFVTFRVTPKSDVYSFGVVLLELMTGLPAVIQDPMSVEPMKTGLATWASAHIKLNQWKDIIDPNLEISNLPEAMEAMEAMMKIAGDCVERISLQRPDIVEVANRLGSIKLTATRTVREEAHRQSNTVSSDRIPLDIDLAFSDSISVSGFRSQFKSVSSDDNPGLNMNVRGRM